MRKPIVVDLRSLLLLEDVKVLGLIYHSLGRTRHTGNRVRDKVVLVRAH